MFSEGFPWLLFSHSVVSDSLRPGGLQHAKLPHPSPSPGACSNSCPLSRWCHPAISSSVIPFSCLQSFPASESFPMSQLFAWGGQSAGVSALASFLPKNTQDWSPLEWTGWISLQSKGLSRVFSKYPGVERWGGEEINCFPPPSTKNSKRVRAASLAEHHEEGEVKPEGHAPSSQMSSLDFFPVISF